MPLVWWNPVSEDYVGFFAYPNPKTTKGFRTKHGGEIVETLEIKEPVLVELNDFVVSYIHSGKPITGPFTVWTRTQGEGPKVCCYCDTLSKANDIAKTLVGSYDFVYVTKHD